MENSKNIINLSTREQFADVLGIDVRKLNYLLFHLPESEKYTSFYLQKKNGGKRQISAPKAGLKNIQRVFATALLDVYPGKSCVHGYLKNKGIRSNASGHIHKKWIVNLDLSDFFPSIHFGRVRGLFLNPPFSYSESLAKDVANLCCYEGSLPQGAPTSPIISNFVCWRLDNQLMKFAKANKCFYSRYADDITFSSNLAQIPEGIGVIKDDCLSISEELCSIISDNGFLLNREKTRYSYGNNRQEVTGLIVNSNNVNVKRSFYHQVRAMIHSWEKYGIKAAAEEHFNKYNYKHKSPTDIEKSYERELIGKLGYLKFIKRYKYGQELFDSPVYQRLAERVNVLAPEAKLYYHTKAVETSSKPMIFCEGKTDWILIKKALSVFQNKGEFRDLDISFREYGELETAGLTTLIDFCNAHTVQNFKHPCICVFDRDAQKSTNRVVKDKNEISHLGHNIHAMLLPIPNFRNFDEICIEQLFTDDEIMTEDDFGRRLYLSTEFDTYTGQHKENPNLIYRNTNYLKSKYPRILDSGVYNEEGKNVALPKRDFAKNCFEDKEHFSNFSYEGFRPLFEKIRSILNS